MTTPVFSKKDIERLQAKKLKKQYNRKLQHYFGTKRPTAGRVQRFFSTYGLLQSHAEFEENTSY